MTARDLKLARERGRALPRHHPLYRRKLELSAEHTALAFGHRSLLENCPLFLCLILGVHSSGNFPAIREINREFLQFRAISAIPASINVATSAPYSQIPYTS